jgi:hypothetical protein
MHLLVSSVLQSDGFKIHWVTPVCYPMATMHWYTYRLSWTSLHTDGVFAKGEREWILGFASTVGKFLEIILGQQFYVSMSNVGINEGIIKQLEAYEPGTSQDANSMFSDVNKAYVKDARLGLLFHAFRASSADGELHQKEVEVIYNIGKKLGVNDEKIKELHALSNEEDTMRKKRLSILFPQGLGTSLKSYKEQFS